jgi:hypothetical protein
MMCRRQEAIERGSYTQREGKERDRLTRKKHERKVVEMGN